MPPGKTSTELWPYYSGYLAISAAAVYFMRMSPESKMTTRHLEPIFTGAATTWTYPGRPDIAVRRVYTGFKAVDELLCLLVTAFLAGPAVFHQHIRLEQVQFLLDFGPVLVLMSIESARSRRWSLVYFTSVWALLYQTIGGAIILPLWFLAHTYTFSKPGSQRDVPVSYAKTLLPAFAFGYLIPTGMMYYPFKNIDNTMLATALWQPSPIFFNIIWITLSTLIPKSGAPIRHLQRCLLISGVFAAVFHLTTIYACFSSAHPEITFKSIFVPIANVAVRFEDAIHYIFQNDYLWIFAATTLFCFQTASQSRLKRSSTTSGIWDALTIVAGTVLVGPGATLIAVCYGEKGSLRKI